MNLYPFYPLAARVCSGAGLHVGGAVGREVAAVGGGVGPAAADVQVILDDEHGLVRVLLALGGRGQDGQHQQQDGGRGQEMHLGGCFEDVGLFGCLIVDCWLWGGCWWLL